MKKHKILFTYAFYAPCDVVSARIYQKLCEELAKSEDLDISVFTSDRYYVNSNFIENKKEVLNGVNIHRFSRVNLNQERNFGRVFNSFYLTMKWFLSILFSKYDVVVIGTDPQFSYYVIPLLKLFKRKLKVVIWTFDLYPEAIIANQMGIFSSIARRLRFYNRFCYRLSDLIVDIGKCMRARISSYEHNTEALTIPPWSLTEPIKEKINFYNEQDEKRIKYYGNKKLVLLYSGTLGQAHKFEEFIELARIVRDLNSSIEFCFSCRGGRLDALRNSLDETDTNIKILDFVDQSELPDRLLAADIHMISLGEEWDGVVLPSKFFAALATGRPVLYLGSKESSIYSMIDQHNVGFNLNEDNIDIVAKNLCDMADNKDHLEHYHENAYELYHSSFSSSIAVKAWEKAIRSLLG